jgi:EAL and modified HD-GYP domain-containing signal transduction protein
MQDHPVLGHVALGYSPMIDRERVVVATRLTIFPERPDAAPDAAALLKALEEVWPRPEAAGGPELELTLRPMGRPAGAPVPPAATGKTALPKGGLALNIAGEALLKAVMQAGPGAGRLLEIPAFMAGQADSQPLLQALHAQGVVLLLKGRPLAPLAPETLDCFSFSVVELDEDRRHGQAGPPGVRKVHSVYGGIRSTRDADSAFERGAVAVLGWPHEDPAPVAVGRAAMPADVSVVMELINGVEAEQPVPKLEAILKRDPALAFRLMRYLNSPAFGLSVEVTSFGHALMLLGYARLKRWLVLLLASASKGAKMRPLMHAAVRRGLLMEELVRSQDDRELAGELFICGVFSLLDRLLQQPFEHLLTGVPVPERVQQALRGDGGPFLPYLDLVRAIEAESVYDIRECAERLFLSPEEVNRALLHALHVARTLE